MIYIVKYKSERGRQGGFAESQFKSWLSMGRKCNDLYCKTYDLSYTDTTDSQNHNLSFGSTWDGKQIELYSKMYDLS